MDMPGNHIDSVIQDFIDSLGHKAQCTDNIKEGVRLLPKSYAVQKRYISINHKLAFYIWLDIDNVRPDQFDSIESRIIDENIPRPTLVIRNRDNGRGHAAWRLDRPVCMTENGHKAPQDFFKAIRRAFAIRMGADMNFTGTHVKNPCLTDHYVVTTNNISYSLDELAAVMDHKMAFYATTKQAMQRQEASSEDKPLQGFSRNCDLFNTTRTWAYDEVKFYSDYLSWEENCLCYVRSHNTFSEKLPFKEERSIAKSIAKWTWQNRAVLQSQNYKRPKLDSTEIKQRQSKAAAITNAKKKQATIKRLEAAIAKLIETGRVVTKKAVQLISEVCYKTVQRYWDDLKNFIQKQPSPDQTITLNTDTAPQTSKNSPKANAQATSNRTFAPSHQVYRGSASPNLNRNTNTNIIGANSPEEPAKSLTKSAIDACQAQAKVLTDGEMIYLGRTLDNLVSQHKLRFNRGGLLAQCVFALTNEPQFKDIDSFRHKVNILAKLIREGQWRVPKGFYQYSSAGQALYQTQLQKEEARQVEKQQEMDSSRAVMGKLMSRLNFCAWERPSALTQKAVALAKQLKYLNTKIRQLAIKGRIDERHILSSLAEKLVSRIKDLLSEGADRDSVQAVFAEVL
jgi:hypothetical protein